MDGNLRRSIILDNYQNPLNKEPVEDDQYVHINMNNESCIDEIDLWIKQEGNIITDIHFDGEACAISTSATSIMIRLLMGKTVEEVRTILTNYENMINEQPYDKEILEEAIVYDEIYKQPNRKKCALLPYMGMEKFLASINKKEESTQ